MMYRLEEMSMVTFTLRGPMHNEKYEVDPRKGGKAALYQYGLAVRHPDGIEEVIPWHLLVTPVRCRATKVVLKMGEDEEWGVCPEDELDKACEYLGISPDEVRA